MITATPPRARATAAKRQCQCACQDREPLARRRFEPAARSRRDPADWTVLTSTRPHDG
jgi:hypothetical protein